jgi:hypothetical protein
MKSQELAKGRSASPFVFNEVAGVFDDANMKCAVDWLAMEHGVPPEVSLDHREWSKMVKQDFDGDESHLRVQFPRPWHTFVFAFPVAIFRRFINSASQSPKAAEKLE